MDSHALIALSAIIVLGVGAQWVAWRIRFPAILLLLITGFAAGPIAGWLHPDELLGDLLFPIVSLSVGVILFEGGLSLKLSELRQMGRSLANLLLIGAPVTWILTTFAAKMFLGMTWPVAFLLGAVLVVTGPTVILPLLRMIRPRGQSGSLLKWEGILIDPVGATLALLVYEAMRAGSGNEATVEVIKGVVMTIVIGVVFGGLAGWLLTVALRRYWIPDQLHSPVTLLLVTAVFAASNYVQHESGLLATTVMGIWLANQRSAHIAHIVEFKENIRVLLISGLFIVLAARLQLAELQQLPWAAAFFLAAVVIIIRPVSVWLSTLGSTLTKNERIFLMCMAPRGIVAASVSSIFALQLAEVGYEGVELLAPVTFLVIVGTVVIYGLFAGRVANKLGIADPHPNGLLIVGAHRWSRQLAQELHDVGVPILMADTNYAYISAARMQGFRTYFGNILSEHGEDQMDLSGIGRLIALTANDEVNTLAAMRFGELFGRSEVFQLAREKDQVSARYAMAERMRGRTLFAEALTYKEITRLRTEGWLFKRTNITDEFTMDHYRAHYGEDAHPMFVVDVEGRVRPMTVKEPPRVGKGATLISLVKPETVSAMKVAQNELEQEQENDE